MKNLKEIVLELPECIKTAQKKIDACATMQELELIKTEFLGRKEGLFSEFMQLLSSANQEEKCEFGPLINHAKKTIEDLYTIQKTLFLTNAFQIQEEKHKHFDVTAYKPGHLRGSLHPYTQVTKKLCDIFSALGYQYIDGPEVETEYYNFDALNIPAHHPA